MFRAKLVCPFVIVIIIGMLCLNFVFQVTNLKDALPVSSIGICINAIGLDESAFSKEDADKPRFIFYDDNETTPIVEWNNWQGFTRSNLDSVEPPPYLKGYRAPCWKQRLDEPNDEVYIQCLPSIFLVGFPKCGTTDLFYSLSLNEDIVIGNTKEPHFWSWKWTDKGLGPYLSCFQSASRKISEMHPMDRDHGHIKEAIDGSSTTIWENELWMPREFRGENAWNPTLLGPLNTSFIPGFLDSFIPGIRVIVIMRDPVERLYSGYFFHDKKANCSQKEFHNKTLNAIATFRSCTAHHTHEFCTYNFKRIFPDRRVLLHVGIYAIFIENWLRVYPGRIHFVRLEDYHRNDTEVTANVIEFLGMDKSKSKLQKSPDIRNAGGKRKKETGDMWKETRLLLQEFYSPFNHQLAGMLHDQRYTWGY